MPWISTNHGQMRRNDRVYNPSGLTQPHHPAEYNLRGGIVAEGSEQMQMLGNQPEYIHPGHPDVSDPWWGHAMLRKQNRGYNPIHQSVEMNASHIPRPRPMYTTDSGHSSLYVTNPHEPWNREFYPSTLGNWTGAAARGAPIQSSVISEGDGIDLDVLQLLQSQTGSAGTRGDSWMSSVLQRAQASSELQQCTTVPNRGLLPPTTSAKIIPLELRSVQTNNSVNPLMCQASPKAIQLSMDSKIRVRNPMPGSTVTSRKLWKKYGEKVVQRCSPDTQGFMKRTGYTKRSYYKCFFAGCEARMSVDYDEESKVTKPPVTTGHHCHTFEILEERMLEEVHPPGIGVVTAPVTVVQEPNENNKRSRNELSIIDDVGFDNQNAKKCKT